MAAVTHGRRGCGPAAETGAAGRGGPTIEPQCLPNGFRERSCCSRDVIETQEHKPKLVPPSHTYCKRQGSYFITNQLALNGFWQSHSLGNYLQLIVRFSSQPFLQLQKSANEVFLFGSAWFSL